MQTGLSSNDDTAPLDLRTEDKTYSHKPLKRTRKYPLSDWKRLRATGNQLETLACFIYSTMRKLFDFEHHNFVLTTYLAYVWNKTWMRVLKYSRWKIDRWSFETGLFSLLYNNFVIL